MRKKGRISEKSCIYNIQKNVIHNFVVEKYPSHFWSLIENVIQLHKRHRNFLKYRNFIRRPKISEITFTGTSNPTSKIVQSEMETSGSGEAKDEL